MAKKTASVRHLRDRDGRYFARVAVPAPLQSIVGKCELLEPLGPDRRDAIFRLPAAVARFNAIIAAARKGMPPAPPSVSIPHAVHGLYEAELADDQFTRFSDIEGMSPAEYQRLFGEPYLFNLRKLAGGFISEDDIAGGFVDATIGWAIDDATKGKDAPARGSKAWIELAKAMASTRLEAFDRSLERDRGDFNGKPSYAPLIVPPPLPEQATAPLSIESLFQGYIASLARTGRGVEAGKRWRSVFDSLKAHLGHDDALALTKADIRAWIETLHARLSAKTIKDTYLGAAKAVFTDAFDHDKLPTNPTHGVKIKLGRPDQGRDKGFTTDEARAILRLSRSYEPKPSDNPQTRESDSLIRGLLPVSWTPRLGVFMKLEVADAAKEVRA